MVDMNTNDENTLNVVRVADELVRYLLVELAWHRNLEAGIDSEAPREVVIRGQEDEVIDLLETARPAAKLLKARKLEIIAEAVIAAGGKPSAMLLEMITKKRRKAGLNEQSQWSAKSRFSQN